MSLVKCPKCKSDMNRITPDEEIEKMNLDRLQRLEFKRNYICTKTSCSHIHRLSAFEINKYFALSRLKGGKSKDEIISEIKDKGKEIEKELKGNEKSE
jgi:transcription initiation factor IIE alpha subunit